MERYNELGLVETIYEAYHEEEGEDKDDEEENSVSSSTISTAASSFSLSSIPCSSPSSTPDLQTILDEWSKAVGYNYDIVILLYEDYFLLHREPMTACSRFLRQNLRTSNEVRVSPPFNITVETFTAVAIFCYIGAVTITPFNLAALTVAAELLGLEGDGGEGSLADRTEEYFRREISGDEEKAEDVLWTCVGILPGGGKAAAGLAAKCVQVLRMPAGVDYGEAWTMKLVGIPVDRLFLIMQSMGGSSVNDQDVLYRLVHEYLEANSGELTEQEKLSICDLIDCTKLSHHFLLHLVQDRHIPHSFIFKTILLSHPTATTTTLCDFINHDAIVRQASNLAIRMESLERDFAGLRNRLLLSEEKQLEMESAGRIKNFQFLHANAGENGLSSAASPERSGIGKRRGLGRKLLEAFRRLFRRDKE